MFFQNQSAQELFELAFPYHYKIYLQLHPIQEKKITIKAFKKLKSTVYKLDRDNVGQYLIFDNIEPNKTINLDEFL
jgi:hypothetical protein